MNSSSPAERTVRRTVAKDGGSQGSQNAQDSAPKAGFAPADDSAFGVTEIQKRLEDKEFSIVDFAEKQIKIMSEASRFYGFEPSMGQLDRMLMQHEQILQGLNALYATARWDAEKAAETFLEWHDDKYIEVRDRYNNSSTPGTKWLSQTEIDAVIHTENRAEYASLKSAKIAADQNKAMLERLIKSWEGFQYTLAQLSKNELGIISAGLKTQGDSETDLIPGESSSRTVQNEII